MCKISKSTVGYLDKSLHNQIFSIKGKFVWLSGEPFKYKSWKTGEPNYVPLNQESCVGVHTTWNFNWSDEFCSVNKYKSTKFRPLCKLSHCLDPGTNLNKRIISLFFKPTQLW